MLNLFKSGEVLGKSSKNEISSSAAAATVPAPQQASGQKVATKQPLSYKLTVDPFAAAIGGTVLKPVALAGAGSAAAAGPAKTRVLFCGTYPIGQSNGYSRVVYYISKFLGKKGDIALTIYGFQNYNQTAGSEQRNDIPVTVKMHDALAGEEPKRNGFGEKEIADFLKKNPQDIVVIFNDMVITSALTQTIVNELTPEERKSFLLVSYMDQVYPYQKQQYIQMLNVYFDAIITFTPYWKEVAYKLGIAKTKPMYVLPHGFDHSLYFPIPKKIARIFYQIPDDSFAILNLNRNQPRKRWDHTMMAFADVLARYYQLTLTHKESASSGSGKKTGVTAAQSLPRPIRLVIATMVDGSWNLMELLEHELTMRGVPINFGKECVVALSKPQQLSDRDINILYNACDIGLNTCEGEGYGLCQLEQAAIGCPQVVQKIGGLQEFLNENNSTLVETKMRYYVDKQRDGIGGVAEMGDPKDYADAIWKYYMNPKLVEKHGKCARQEILQHYRWETMVDHFHKIILDLRAGDAAKK